ncbi:hypothetical protein MKX03_025359 [Papaver bracteatum]|nr:hypothetical protein MKX03_025359 [Papaver bracteatum]
MPFKRYVEIGRVALVNYGECYGKLVVIVDVIDQNMKKVLIGAMEAAGKLPDLFHPVFRENVKKKWESSSWGRNFIVQKKRASLNDFDRSMVMLTKIKGEAIRRELHLLKQHAARRELAIRNLMPKKAKLDKQAA